MTSHASEDAETRFLNVDLELVTTAEIDALLAEWADLVILRDSLDDGIRTIWIELGEPDLKDADSTIKEFLTLVESLSPASRKLWDACRDRCFNVGVQAAAGPHHVVFAIASSVLQRVVDVNARVAFTVYGASPHSGE